MCVCDGGGGGGRKAFPEVRPRGKAVMPLLAPDTLTPPC